MSIQEVIEFYAEHGSALHRFLLINGQEFPFAAESYSGPRMGQGMCFMNATHLTLEKDLTYCEGVVGIYGVLIDHAWCIDQKGLVIDPTLTYEPRERFGGYYGVPFRRDYLYKALKKNGVYGLLGWPAASKTVERLFDGKTKNFKAEIRREHASQLE